eukprot:202577_1
MLLTCNESKRSYAVSGYIRAIQRSSKLKMGSDIENLCSLFCGTFEYFEMIGDLITLDKHQRRIVMNNYKTSNTAVGSQIISLSRNTRCYEWKFKVQKTFGDVCIGVIGVDNTNLSSLLRTYFCRNKKYRNYAVKTNGSKISADGYENYFKNPLSTKEEHLITMTMNVQSPNATLSYSINNEPMGKAFEWNMKDEKYRMAVSIYRRCSVELLKYTDH